MKYYNRSITDFFVGHLISYPTPSNLNYFWSFGFTAGMFLIIQMLTGIILSMHYIPNIELAFESLEHIMRDVNYGWFLRHLHSNGASFFFICLFIHIFKNMYYRSYKYPRHYVWASGVIIFVLSMLTAFIGYVLPWGQMSFWGATVITNLFTAIPFVGENIVYWIWGGFSVGNATLNRFFSIHYLLPFVMIILIFLHLALLHDTGSNNPLGVDSSIDKISFYPYFLIKDYFLFLSIFFFFLFFSFFCPSILGHPDNFVKANVLVTPAHIVPEWYFLPFYAILRSIPNKLLGVFIMFFSIFIMLLLPMLDRSKYLISPRFNIIFSLFFWFWLVNVIFLGYLGSLPVEEPFLTASRVCTVLYFFYYILVLIFSLLENNFFDNLMKKPC